MRTGDLVAIGSVAGASALTGFAVGGPLVGIVSAALGGWLAYAGSRANLRPGVIATVLIATIAGGFIGARVVKAICLPESCSGLEVFGGLVIAALLFVGVGLVTALVARSFDEHNERTKAGLPPTGVGCEQPETAE